MAKGKPSTNFTNQHKYLSKHWKTGISAQLVNKFPSHGKTWKRADLDQILAKSFSQAATSDAGNHFAHNDFANFLRGLVKQISQGIIQAGRPQQDKLADACLTFSNVWKNLFQGLESGIQKGGKVCDHSLPTIIKFPVSSFR